MSSAEYLAVASGLVGVWQGAEAIVEWLGRHESGVVWSLALPL